MDDALRRLAGGASATALVAGVLTALYVPGPGDADEVVVPVLLAGAVCTALAWPLERWARTRFSVGRYALVGAVAAFVGLRPAVLSDAVVALLFAVPVGAAGGAVAAAVARLTPRRALAPVAVVALLVCAGSGAAVVRDGRPPHPGSYVVVEGAGPTTAARPLADTLARRLRAEPDPGSDAALGRAVEGLVPVGEGTRGSFGYARTQAERRITVDVDGDLACVRVVGSAVTVADGGC